MASLRFPQWDTDLEYPERRAELLHQLRTWIGSAGLSRLAAAWGSVPPSSISPAGLFDWYDDFSSRHWDFRAGRERNLASAPELTPAQEAAALEAAEAIGLPASRPPRRSEYDVVLILGGLVRACVTRPRYARELVDAGLKVGKVVALGGFRPLAGDEPHLAEQLNVAARNEFGAMLAGLKAAFPHAGEARVETSTGETPGNADWAIARFDDDLLSVIAAPSRDPGRRRANTADTFAWWAGGVPDLPHKHLLLITNPIYVPYQGAAATEALGIPIDVTVETAGISAAAADLGPHTQPFGPANYLQEIRSAIRGYRSLHATVSRMPETPSPAGTS